MKILWVKDVENAQRLADELAKSGATIVWHDGRHFSAYRNGKKFKDVRVQARD